MVKRLQMNVLYLFVQKKPAFLYFLLKHTRCENNFVHCCETAEALDRRQGNQSVQAYGVNYFVFARSRL